MLIGCGCRDMVFGRSAISLEDSDELRSS
jgi:hypothetical protein